MKRTSDGSDLFVLADFAQKYAERLQHFLTDQGHTLPEEHQASIKRVISNIDRRLIALKHEPVQNSSDSGFRPRIPKAS
jgi:hypothetical protein